MNPKRKALITTIVMLGLSITLAMVSWSYASHQTGFLSTLLGTLTAIFSLLAVVAVGAVVTIAKTPAEQMANRSKRKRSNSAVERDAPASFEPPPQMPEPRPQSPKPVAKARIASTKKSPQPVAKKPRPVAKSPRKV